MIHGGNHNMDCAWSGRESGRYQRGAAVNELLQSLSIELSCR